MHNILNTIQSTGHEKKALLGNGGMMLCCARVVFTIILITEKHDARGRYTTTQSENIRQLGGPCSKCNRTVLEGAVMMI